MKKDPLKYIEYILEQSEKALHYRNQYIDTENEVFQEALERVMLTLTDATKFIPQDWKDAYPAVPWREIVDFRNFIVHGYLEIDATIVRDTVKDDLPVLVEALKDMVEKYGK